MIIDIINVMPFKTQIIYLVKRLLLFYNKLKKNNVTRHDVKPYKVYWISPEKIVYHTNYISENQPETTSYAHRVIPKNMRGMILDGDWDKSTYPITELINYKSIKQRIIDGSDWKDTEIYKWHLNIINNRELFNNKKFWGIDTEKDLINRCDYLDEIISDIKNNGYELNINKFDNLDYGEIDVNIGRDGEYLFQDGRHRLSISKILNICKIPVFVFCRHKEWQKYRSYLYDCLGSMPNNEFIVNLIHPDLNHISYDERSEEVFNNLIKNFSIKNGKILDMNPINGYYCHRLETLGYDCYLYDEDEIKISLINKLKKYENKKFSVINNEFNNEDVNRLEPDIILYLFTDYNYSENKIDIIMSQIETNLNLKELYLQFIDIKNKNQVINIKNNIVNNTRYNKYKKIYEKSDNCVYKIFL